MESQAVKSELKKLGIDKYAENDSDNNKETNIPLNKKDIDNLDAGNPSTEDDAKKEGRGESRSKADTEEIPPNVRPLHIDDFFRIIFF